MDASDRTMRVSGELRLQPEQRRSTREQQAAGKPDRLATDHGGHYIAREFGGPEIAANHFAQDATFNKSEYRKIEIEWKNRLLKGEKITVQISSEYSRASKRPSNIVVNYTVNGKTGVRRPLPNAKKAN